MVSYVVKKSLLLRYLKEANGHKIDRTIELLQFIEPNPKSETIRNNIVSYIKGLITGHVPIKVYKIYFIFYSLIILTLYLTLRALSPAMFLSRYIKNN